jgi:hypothetical protein
LLRRAEEGGSWSVRVALAKTAMFGTRFAENRKAAVPIDDAELDRYLVDQASPIGLHRRSGWTVPPHTLSLPAAFPVHRHSTSVGVLIRSCHAPCLTGRPRFFAWGSRGGEVRRPYSGAVSRLDCHHQRRPRRLTWVGSCRSGAWPEPAIPQFGQPWLFGSAPTSAAGSIPKGDGKGWKGECSNPDRRREKPIRLSIELGASELRTRGEITASPIHQNARR